MRRKWRRKWVGRRRKWVVEAQVSRRYKWENFEVQVSNIPLFLADRPGNASPCFARSCNTPGAKPKPIRACRCSWRRRGLCLCHQRHFLLHGNLQIAFNRIYFPPVRQRGKDVLQPIFPCRHQHCEFWDRHWSVWCTMTSLHRGQRRWRRSQHHRLHVRHRPGCSWRGSPYLGLHVASCIGVVTRSASSSISCILLQCGGTWHARAHHVQRWDRAHPLPCLAISLCAPGPSARPRICRPGNAVDAFPKIVVCLLGCSFTRVCKERTWCKSASRRNMTPGSSACGSPMSRWHGRPLQAPFAWRLPSTWSRSDQWAGLTGVAFSIFLWEKHGALLTGHPQGNQGAWHLAADDPGHHASHSAVRLGWGAQKHELPTGQTQDDWLYYIGICLSIYLSTYLSIYLYACMYVCMYVYIYIYTPFLHTRMLPPHITWNAGCCIGPLRGATGYYTVFFNQNNFKTLPTNTLQQTQETTYQQKLPHNTLQNKTYKR